jgi:hypothetical protein
VVAGSDFSLRVYLATVPGCFGIPGKAPKRSTFTGEIKPLKDVELDALGAWSPDGESFLYRARDELRVVSLGTGTVASVEQNLSAFTTEFLWKLIDRASAAIRIISNEIQRTACGAPRRGVPPRAPRRRNAWIVRVTPLL